MGLYFDTIFRVIVATIQLKKIGKASIKQVKIVTLYSIVTKIYYAVTYNKNILCQEIEVMLSKN